LSGSLSDAFDDNLIKIYNPYFINVADELNLLDRLNDSYNFNLKDDNETESVTRILPDILILLNNLLKKGNVLIHCLEGKSRSVCVVLVYLVFYQHFDFYSAYEFIKKKRPCIDIYPLYFKEIEQYCLTQSRT
jgi:protein-tyrosine phosphatase